MSLWQHKNIHKKHLLWAKLFGFCLLFHLIFLFWIFCVYRDNSYILSISVNKNMDYSTPIMFVPLGVQTTSRPQIVTQKKPIPKKPAVHIKPAIEKKVAVTEVKKPTTIAAVAPSSSAKASKDTSALAANVKKMTPPAPAVAVKKPEEIKKELPKIETPAVVNKIEEVKKVAAIETPKPIPAQKETPQPPIAQALDIEQTIVPQSYAEATESRPVIPENAHISHNYREVEALRRGAQLQKELVQKWKPPIGVSPECMCEISFCVNTSGGIENLKMVKNSGVVMYDISARQALFAMKMPQWTHGKPLIISFKQ